MHVLIIPSFDHAARRHAHGVGVKLAVTASRTHLEFCVWRAANREMPLKNVILPPDHTMLSSFNHNLRSQIYQDNRAETGQIVSAPATLEPTSNAAAMKSLLGSLCSSLISCNKAQHDEFRVLLVKILQVRPWYYASTYS